jgi:hypothetical protein
MTFVEYAIKLIAFMVVYGGLAASAVIDGVEFYV